MMKLVEALIKIAVMVATGRGAESGILIKGGEALANTAKSAKLRTVGTPRLIQLSLRYAF